MNLHIEPARAHTLTYRIIIASEGMCLIIHPNGKQELEWMKPGQ